MKIRCLGVGSALNTLMFKTCFAINDRLLIDVGPEAATILRRSLVDLGKLSGVLLTHLHGDHTLGLPQLICEFVLVDYEGEAFRIYGPPGVQELTRELLTIWNPEVPPDRFLSKAKVKFGILTDGSWIDFGDLRVQAVSVVHGEAIAFGFSVEAPDATVFISGDTALCPAVEENVRKADFSFLDVMTESQRLKSHMNMTDLLQLRKTLSDNQYTFAVHRTFEHASAMDRVIFPSDFALYELRRGRKPQLLGQEYSILARVRRRFRDNG